jgi:hypothetical protein
MQIVIDSCCATVAEYQKRGKDFWNEFELYVADRIGKPSISKGFLGNMQKAYAALPSRLLLVMTLKGPCFWCQYFCVSYVYVYRYVVYIDV